MSFRLHHIVSLGMALCLLTFGAYALVSSFAEAQYMRTVPTISLEAFPPFPAPNSLVTVSLSSYGTNMRDATIDWTIGGVAATTSKNARSIQVPTGDGERTTVVTARIASSQNGTQTLTKTLAPGAVDIVVEPQTTVPEGYRGRGLATPDTQVRLIAVPHLYKNGAQIPASEVRYTWFANGAMMFGGPQLGTSATTIDLPRYGNLEVAVIAESKDGTRTARAQTTVTSEKARMLYYEVNTLYGMIMEAPRRFSTSKDELSIQAVPYYMNDDIGNGNTLTHTWVEDGSLVPQGPEAHTMTVTRDTGRASRHIEHTYTSESYDQIRGVGSFDVMFTNDTNALPMI